MTTLYLVRHGETFDNARQIIQGQTQGELNENGIKQAQQVAKELEKEDISIFLASDLHRSQQTCAIIAAPHQKEVTSTKLLRERDWGAFTGKYIPSLSNLKDPSTWPEDIESIEDLKKRAKELLDWISVSFPDKKVLAVGHGIINKAIQSVFFDKPMNEIKPMTNAELRILELK